MVQGPPGTGKTWTGARLAVDLLERGDARRRRRDVAQGDQQPAAPRSTRPPTRPARRFRGWKKCGDAGATRYESDAGRLRQRSRPTRTTGRSCSIGAHRLALGGRGRARRRRRAVHRRGRPDVARRRDRRLPRARATSCCSAIRSSSPTSARAPTRSAAAPPCSSTCSASTTPCPPTAACSSTRPGACTPTSATSSRDTMYDGRLTLGRGLRAQRIDSPGLSGSGLRMLGRRPRRQPRPLASRRPRRSPPQVASCSPAGPGPTARAAVRPLTLDDILVVAPYNAQVRCLRSALPAGARVGTVDKFQGQEAPVVFFSMASSTGEDVTRGMGFLFSRNRLNVAVSRAQPRGRRVLATAAGRPLQHRRGHAAREHALPVRRRRCVGSMSDGWTRPTRRWTSSRLVRCGIRTNEQARPARHEAGDVDPVGSPQTRAAVPRAPLGRVRSSSQDRHCVSSRTSGDLRRWVSWDRCPEHATRPQANADFWEQKLARNVERDRDTERQLEVAGWTVVRIWSTTIRTRPPRP